MKKQQKIIELRTAAKLKIAEIQTEIAVARSKAAEERARLLCDRVADIKGFEADSTERFDIIAKNEADLAWIKAQLAAAVAQYKCEIQQTKAECEKLCAAAKDDPEPEKEQPQQATVYCDGSEHAARIVARRIINKMPHIQKGGYLFVHIIRNDGGCFVGVSEQGEGDYISTVFSKDGHCEKSESAFVEKARRLFAEEPEIGNSHVAEPMASALDALFGGNPVEQVDNLISDTIKDGKEGGNE